MKADRQRRIAALKLAVFDIIGGECFNCGSFDDIEVDHIDGRNWDIKTVNQETRWRIYLAEAKEGLLCALCARCNGKDGWWRRKHLKPGRTHPDVPF